MMTTLAVTLVMVPTNSVADDSAELSALKRQVSEQSELLRRQQDMFGQMFEQMAERISELEAKTDSQAARQPAPAPATAAGQRVDLNADDAAAELPDSGDAHVLANPWYKNVRVDGFGGAGFVKTGRDAKAANGNFVNYEATINVEAEVWEDVSYFHELQTVRLADEGTKFLRTGEVYLHLKDPLNALFGIQDSGVGIKLGRMDIPFGEDYLTQDVIDNPLVTLSAAYPYGVDEGIVVYGQAKGVGWVAALMEGSAARAADDRSEKFASLKLYGNPTENLYLSASVFHNGDALVSAFEYGGSHIYPVGFMFPSTLGESASAGVDAYSYELDARYDFATDRYLKLQWGTTWVEDDDPLFDRTLYYAQIEPKFNLGARFDHKLYLIARASAIGTFDDQEGFGFDGKPFANGKESYGYDSKALYRYAVGLGYWMNPRVVWKLEYSYDDFKLIDGSQFNADGEKRHFLGSVIAAKF